MILARGTASWSASALVLLALSSCSSAPTKRSLDFSGLDARSKRIYLAHYPLLDPARRRELLESDDAFYRLLRDWELDDRFFRREEGGPPRFVARSENYTMLRLDIESGDLAPGVPVIGGTALPLQAKAIFADGRVADATGDVEWQAGPSIVRIEESELRYGCVHSEVSVSADLSSELRATRVFDFRKPLASLEIRPASWAFNEVPSIQLAAIARCADGTETDVSCLVQWSLPDGPGPEVHLSGCGFLSVPAAPAGAPAVVSVQATYGGAKASWKASIPRR